MISPILFTGSREDILTFVFSFKSSLNENSSSEFFSSSEHRKGSPAIY